MKKVILIIVVAAMAVSLQAQENSNFRKNTFYAGGSLLSQINSQLINLGTSGKSFSGMFGYERHLNKKWSLDFSIYGSSVLINNVNQDNYNASVFHVNFIAAGHYTWVRSTKRRFYSGLGIGAVNIGVAIQDNRNPNNIETLSIPGGFAYQLDLIGVEYNPWPWLSVRSEIGFGNQGIVQVGVCLKP